MYEYRAKLVRVVDGDTYDLEVDLGFRTLVRHRFRLVEVNTPEMFGKNACEAGKQAQGFVMTLLAAQGEWLTIRTQKDKQGKYGRWLADVILTVNGDGEAFSHGGRSLSSYLIQKGHAVPYGEK